MDGVREGGALHSPLIPGEDDTNVYYTIAVILRIFSLFYPLEGSEARRIETILFSSHSSTQRKSISTPSHSIIKKIVPPWTGKAP